MHSFEIESALAAAPEKVWEHVVTPSGINGELMPLIRMTTHVARPATAISPSRRILPEKPADLVRETLR